MQKLPKLKNNIHKGSVGRVLLIGGSQGMSGSIILASKAALRVGAGLVFTAVPNCIGDIVEHTILESMTIYCSQSNGKFDEDAWNKIELKAQEADVIVVGPGMGLSAGAKKIIKEVSQLTNKRIVLDADALNILSESNVDFKSELILTPHVGEMQRLVPNFSLDSIEDKKKAIKHMVGVQNICIVLKSHETIVGDKNSYYEEKAGNPGMATGGMGDVLAGTIGGLLLIKELPIFDLVCSAVHLHSLTADFLVQQTSMRSLLPSDIISAYPQMLSKLEN